MAKDFENPEVNPEEEFDEEIDGEEEDLIELVDEDGNTDTYELLASFDLNGNHYLAISEPIKDETVESVEVFILKTVKDADGNDVFETADEAESDEAFNYFLTLVDAEEE